MYFIVMKYLKNNEIFSLALSCKKIWERVSRDDYFRKLLTESYLRFFNCQFSVHQLPFENFIPLMKQQRSNNSLGYGRDLDSTREESDGYNTPVVAEERCKNPLWKKEIVGLDSEMMDVSQPSIFEGIHAIYRSLIELKYNFMSDKAEAFASLELPISAAAFSREMLLEASQCENTCFMLPPLQRDSASRKGIHYITEKLIVTHHSNSFPYMISSKIREQLSACLKRTTEKFFTEDFKHFIEDLMRVTSIESQTRTMEESIISYTLNQFSLICKIQSLELQKLKEELVGKNSYPYLNMVQEKQKQAKFLYKKITMNLVN